MTRRSAPAGLRLSHQVGVISAALLFLVALAVTAILASERQQQAAAQSATHDRNAQVAVVELEDEVDVESSYLAQFALTRDPAALAEFDAASAHFGSQRMELADYSDDVGLRPAMRHVLDAGDAWEQWALGTREVLAGPDPAAADFARGDILRADFERANLVLAARAQQAAIASRAEMTRLASIVTGVTVVAATAGAAALIGLVVLLTTSTLRPLERLAAAARSVSAGERRPIPTSVGGAEVRQLAAALESWRRTVDARVALAEETLQIGEAFTVEKVLAAGAARLSGFLEAPLVGYTVYGDSTEHGTAGVYAEGKLAMVEAAQIPVESPSHTVTLTGRPLITDLRDQRWSPLSRQYAAERQLGPALAVPLRSGGKTVGVMTFVRSISQPVFAEDDVDVVELAVPQLAGALHVAQLLEELQAANRHKSEFLAHMSHELRTPLNSVLGFGQLLGDSSFGTLNDRQRRYLSHIMSSGAHLLALINDVLDLSKVEAGQLTLQRERVELRPVLVECVSDVRPLAAEKSLRLTIDGHQDVAALADRRRVVQIVLNLLSNAIKFTPEEGQVWVSISADGSTAVITVRDTGIGIAPADQQRIFDAFTQLAAIRTRNQEGTGLGLTLSRRLAQEMGGQLTVESRVGQGSSFHLRLPMATTPAIRRSGRQVPVGR